MKFRYMKVDLESQTTYTCHAAQPHKIDFDWLEKNPKNLFNHDINVRERQMMLLNQRAPSCEQNCWPAEDQGQVSPRIYQGGRDKTHFQIHTTPEIVDLTVGADCNLTCSYCCKEYSSAWRRDLDGQGAYPLSGDTENRYQLTGRDRVLMNISQPELMDSDRYRMLFDEIKSISPGIKRLDVTGGEPFLNNRIVDLLNDLDLPDDAVIRLYTGLGLQNARFNRILDRLRHNNKLRIIVSSENIKDHLQFNRYGITWPQFESNLQSIIDRHMVFHFHCTISNLTAFGFAEFYEHYRDREMTLTFAYQPRMQALHVLDPDSKIYLENSFQHLPSDFRQRLSSTMSAEPSDIERQDLAKFLTTFVQRRPNLNLNLYPKSFLSWLGISHVV